MYAGSSDASIGVRNRALEKSRVMQGGSDTHTERETNIPVDAPLGTAALAKLPSLRPTSTCTRPSQQNRSRFRRKTLSTSPHAQRRAERTQNNPLFPPRSISAFRHVPRRWGCRGCRRSASPSRTRSSPPSPPAATKLSPPYLKKENALSLALSL